MNLDNIYKSLDMTPENGLCIRRDNCWKGRLPRRLEFLIEDKLLKPDAFFIFDKKPLISNIVASPMSLSLKEFLPALQHVIK